MKSEYNLSPSKETYNSLKSDVSPVSAVKELIDNVLDNWMRLSSEDSDVTIEVGFDADRGRFRIKDDSGGIEVENIEKIFSLGETTVDEVNRSIGAFGMGAKKAIVRLGKTATIKSRSHSASSGYGFTVDEEWLNKPNEWTIQGEEFPDMDRGTTVISIEDLQLDFAEGEEDIDELEARFTDPGQFVDELVAELSETYEEFLRGRAGPNNSEISIFVNDREVPTPSPPEWSYTPYDGYHVRSFKNIELDVPSRKEPVYMDLTAGLLTSGGQEDGGTDIYIQNRKIVSKSTEQDGGWGTDFLPNYQPALGRSRFQIRLYTDGATDTLPWDTQKSNIDPYDSVMRAAFDWLSRVGGKFTIRYGALPGKLTEPYSSSSRYAVQEDPYDYAGHTYVRHSSGHTPNESHPEASEVKKAVKAHVSEYSVFVPDLIKEELQPGYKARYEDQANQHNWKVPEEIATMVPEAVLYCWLDEIDKAANNDADNSQEIDFTDNSPWWKPYYEQQLAAHIGDEKVPSSRKGPQIEERVVRRTEAGNLPQTLLDEAARTSKQSEGSFEEENTGEGSEQGDDTADESATSDQSSEETSSLDEPSGSDSGDGRKSTESTENTSETSSDQGRGGSDTRAGARKAASDKELIIIETDQETHGRLCEELDVSSNESSEKIGTALLRRFIELSKSLSESDIE